MPRTNWVNDIASSGLHGNGLSNLFLLSDAGIKRLAVESATASFTSVIYGNFVEYCRSIVWFPISQITAWGLNLFQANSVQLKLGYNLSSLDIEGYPAVNANRNTCFTMGTLECPALRGDYRDYEPYSSYEIYLPFYGFAGLKAADIIGQLLTLSISLDWSSGQGTYFLENDTRIIGKYTAQIGVPIPFGQTGASDTVRNLLLGAVKSGAAIAGAAITPIIGANVTNYDSVRSGSLEDFSEVRSQWPETGRLRKSGETKKSSSWESTQRGTRTSNAWKGHVANSCFDTAATALANLQFHPQIDRSNNPASDGVGTTIPRLIIRQSRVRDADINYRQIYGMPYGKTVTLSEVSGYTKCSSVRLSAKNFGTITSGELSLIEQFLLSGVVFAGEYKQTLRAPQIISDGTGSSIRIITSGNVGNQVSVYVDGEEKYQYTTISNSEGYASLGDLDIAATGTYKITAREYSVATSSLYETSPLSSEYEWKVEGFTTQVALVDYPNTIFTPAWGLDSPPIIKIVVTQNGWIGYNEDEQVQWTWEVPDGVTGQTFVGLYSDDIGMGIGTKVYTAGESFYIGGTFERSYWPLWTYWKYDSGEYTLSWYKGLELVASETTANKFTYDNTEVVQINSHMVGVTSNNIGFSHDYGEDFSIQKVRLTITDGNCTVTAIGNSSSSVGSVVWNMDGELEASTAFVGGFASIEQPTVSGVGTVTLIARDGAGISYTFTHTYSEGIVGATATLASDGLTITVDAESTRGS